MPKCVIKKCRNNTRTTKKKDGVTYHRFPLHEIMREKWRKLVAKERSERYYKPKSSSVICSDHFLKSDVYVTTKGYERLKKTAVPHIEFSDDSGTSLSRKRILEVAEISDQQTPSHVLELTAPESEQPLLSNTPINSPSLSSSGLDSVLDSPKTTYFKKELRKCYEKLRYKDRQVRNLKKQNKRLIKANSCLKEIIVDFKKKRLIDDSLSNDLQRVMENNNKCITKILSSNVRK